MKKNFTSLLILSGFLFASSPSFASFTPNSLKELVSENIFNSIMTKPGTPEDIDNINQSLGRLPIELQNYIFRSEYRPEKLINFIKPIVFSFIQNLDLSDMKITNIRYLNIGKVKNLTSLNLSRNKIAYVNVDNLTNLTSLNLNRNKIAYVNVDNLTNLTSLDLSYNNSKGSSILVKSVKNIISDILLHYLVCSYNVYFDQNHSTVIEGAQPRKKLTNLTSLNLSYCHPDTIILDSIDLTNLTYLDAEATSNFNFNHLTNLISLKMHTHSFSTKETVQDLGNLTNLTSLQIRNRMGGYSETLDENISELTKLTNLTHLVLNVDPSKARTIANMMISSLPNIKFNFVNFSINPRH